MLPYNNSNKIKLHLLVWLEFRPLVNWLYIVGGYRMTGVFTPDHVGMMKTCYSKIDFSMSKCRELSLYIGPM